MEGTLVVTAEDKMEAKALVETTINENKDRLNNISKEIWSNPEGSFEERHAHDILTQFFTEEGFQVERNYINATGFRATFGSSEGDFLCYMFNMYVICGL